MELDTELIADLELLDAQAEQVAGGAARVCTVSCRVVNGGGGRSTITD